MTTSVTGVTSVRRALRILEVLATDDRPVALSDIAKRVGLIPSTTHNLLKTLVDEDYATSALGSYQLGPRAAALASIGEESLRQALQSTADWVGDTAGHSTIAVALIDRRPVEVVQSPGTDLVTVSRIPVTNASALRLATGRLLVAYEDPDTWPHYIKEHAVDKLPLATWRHLLERFRAHGMALRWPPPDELPRKRITGVAVPIWRRTNAKPSWALGCSIPGDLHADELLAAAEMLWKAAGDLSSRIGLEPYPVGRPTAETIAELCEITEHAVTTGVQTG